MLSLKKRLSKADFGKKKEKENFNSRLYQWFLFQKQTLAHTKLSKAHLLRQKDFYIKRGFLTQFFTDKIYFDDFQESPADCPVASLAWPLTGLCIEKDLKGSPRLENHLQNQKVRDQGLEQQNSLVNQYMTVEISCKLFLNVLSVGLTHFPFRFIMSQSESLEFDGYSCGWWDLFDWKAWER